jgi:hypothetical protein
MKDVLIVILCSVCFVFIFLVPTQLVQYGCLFPEEVKVGQTWIEKNQNPFNKDNTIKIVQIKGEYCQFDMGGVKLSDRTEVIQRIFRLENDKK